MAIKQDKADSIKTVLNVINKPSSSYLDYAVRQPCPSAHQSGEAYLTEIKSNVESIQLANQADLETTYSRYMSPIT